MTRDVEVVATAQVAPGFCAAGFRTREVTDVADAASRVGELLDDPEVGVVLIEQRLHDGLPEDLRVRIGRDPLPLVIPFPDPAWAPRREAAEAYIVELLRRAIGYRVRLT